MNNLLSVKQVAFILQVHPLSVRRYIKDKKLKAIKVGGNVRINETDLQLFHRDMETPIIRSTQIVKKYQAKALSEEDPLLRLQGRGASFELTTNKK